MARFLRGSNVAFEGSHANSVAMLANAPIVTSDVEKVFSYLKDLNTSKRAGWTEKHIKDLLMLQ